MPETQEMVIVTADCLARLYCGILGCAGMSAGEADLVAHTLVDADLRGVHSHGATWLPTYVKALRAGWIKSHAEICIVADVGPVVALDGGNGMGQLASVQGIMLAVERAREHGVGVVGVRNSNHNGALAYYTEIAARGDLIGFAATNAGAIMPPTGGTSPLLGSNPLSYSFPAKEELPVIFDMACTVAAWSKFALAQEKGEKIPLGWALDKYCQPTDDPREAMEGLVLPIGGHKGYGLALSIDLLCGVLTGAAFSSNTRIQWPTPNNLGHLFMAIDPTCFMDLDEFKSRVDEEIRRMHNSALAEGSQRVWVPGELEQQTRKERLKSGIPMIRSVIGQLQQLAQELGLAPEQFAIS